MNSWKILFFMVSIAFIILAYGIMKSGGEWKAKTDRLEALLTPPPEDKEWMTDGLAKFKKSKEWRRNYKLYIEGNIKK